MEFRDDDLAEVIKEKNEISLFASSYIFVPVKYVNSGLVLNDFQLKIKDAGFKVLDFMDLLRVLPQ
jgi:hypothetical protein